MINYLRSPFLGLNKAKQNKETIMSFAEFFECWEIEHRMYLEKLVLAVTPHQDLDSEVSLSELVEQVLCHYQTYYDEKSKAAESDVFLMFSPPWFSGFERTLLWASGFKPSVAFQLVKESVGGELTQDQNARIAGVREETRRMEREIAQAMASAQESVAAPPFCGLIKRVASLVDSDMENAVDELKAAMLSVLRDADYLRQHTAIQVLEVLTPLQKIKFLTGTSQFWLRSRRFGMERDRRTN